MKGFGVVLATVAAVLLGLSAPASAYKADRATKIDVMGEWAHPDDDASIIGPCGVWHERYDIRCGIIRSPAARAAATPSAPSRAGARAAARERGPRRALPLGHGRHLLPRPRRLLLQHERAAVAVLLGPGRDAAPDHADHPHDAAGDLHRLHAVARRRPRPPPAGRPLHLGGRQGGGRPDDVPGAAARARTRSTRGRSRRSSPAAARRAPAARRPRRTARPASSRRRPNTSTVAGVWTGYDSPYDWPRRQRPGPAGRHAQELGADPQEGTARVPDPEPDDVQGHRGARLPRFGMTRLVRPVPAERARAAAGRDDAILFGAVEPRSRAGCRSARIEHISFSDFFNVPAQRSRRPCTFAPAGARCGPARSSSTSRRAGRSTPAQRDRAGLERTRADGHVRRHAERDAPRSTATTRSPRCTETGGRTGLHRQRRADRLAGRGPLRALGQVGGVRQLADADRAAGAARRPLAGGAVDGHRRDDHRAGRRPQLVGVAAERRGGARAARRLHGGRDREAVRDARARRRDRPSSSSSTSTARDAAARRRPRRSRSRRRTARRPARAART